MQAQRVCPAAYGPFDRHTDRRHAAGLVAPAGRCAPLTSLREVSLRRKPRNRSPAARPRWRAVAKSVTVYSTVTLTAVMRRGLWLRPGAARP